MIENTLVRRQTNKMTSSFRRGKENDRSTQQNLLLRKVIATLSQKDFLRKSVSDCLSLPSRFPLLDFFSQAFNLPKNNLSNFLKVMFREFDKFICT